MANPLKELFTNQANAIRAGLGDIGTISPSDFPAKTLEIVSLIGTGGSSDDVRYVTFMSYDGTTEYGKKAVAVGDDCADPIARGLFDTPTRESTAQYDYSFYGWATTPNGAADANWNKAVTEDRTVYANFAAVLRYYTITYLDDDGSVLKTESLAYGAMPNYTPEKDGFGFDGWSPAPTYVTGDASYTAVWAEKITFANASWSQIAEISQNGEAENYFAIGDTKTLSLNFSGTIEDVQVRIIGFNHDDLADGSGKAGISIALSQGIVNTAKNVNENTQYGMCYIWETSATRRLLNSGAVYTALPTDLRTVLKSVTKSSNAGYSKDWGGREKNTLYTTNDKVWMLSSTELGMDSLLISANTAHNQGVQYAYYTSETSRQLRLTSGAATIYPTRSMDTTYAASSICVHGLTGEKATSGALGSGKYPVSMFGFCI